MKILQQNNRKLTWSNPQKQPTYHRWADHRYESYYCEDGEWKQRAILIWNTITKPYFDGFRLPADCLSANPERRRGLGPPDTCPD